MCLEALEKAAADTKLSHISCRLFGVSMAYVIACYAVFHKVSDVMMCYVAS